MNKRGQFYLIAAIIIIAILVGFVAILNYAKKSETLFLEDIADELEIETQKVLENEVSGGTDHMDDYGITYSNHIGGEIELYFIKGTSPLIYANKYVNGIKTNVDDSLSIDTENEKIIFTLYGIEHEFELLNEENFYYIIFQEIKGEYYTLTG